MLLQEADPGEPPFSGSIYGPATKIANEKWLICPILTASSGIASENTGYLSQIAFN
ncbi:MAG: hypothetical protein J7639_20230 [Paenibacillaceae bacterium]|nr:hypothetical protein [Paenibacillaceae bacterium]